MASRRNAVVRLAALLTAPAIAFALGGSADGAPPHHVSKAAAPARGVPVWHRTYAFGRLVQDKTWTPVLVTRDGQSFVVAPGTIADFRLERDLMFSDSDGVNGTVGNYILGVDQITFGISRTTLVGYGGHDPAVVALVGAMSDLTMPGTVLLRAAGDQLVLSNGTESVQFTS